MSFLRTSFTNGLSCRLFSTTATRQSDVAKLTLVGRMIKSETRVTSTNKEYVTYTITTKSYPAPPANPDGTRVPPKLSWHTIYCFAPGLFEHLSNIQKGSLVYAEANYELREPDPSAEPGTPFSQRQVFLRHDMLRILRGPQVRSTEGEGVDEHSKSNENQDA